MSKIKRLAMRILGGLLYRLRWIGIKIDLFITVREGESSVSPPEHPENFKLGFLAPDDIDEIIRLEPRANRQEVDNWFRGGKLCFGVWDQSRLVAKMWCDLDECNHEPDRRKLEPDEVYLFAAYSDPEYRGHGLAPMMRNAGYAALREMGRSRFFSYTNFFAIPARRFKAKLGAREEALQLHVGLSDKWSRTMTLKRYS